MLDRVDDDLLPPSTVPIMTSNNIAESEAKNDIDLLSNAILSNVDKNTLATNLANLAAITQLNEFKDPSPPVGNRFNSPNAGHYPMSLTTDLVTAGLASMNIGNDFPQYPPRQSPPMIPPSPKVTTVTLNQSLLDLPSPRNRWNNRMKSPGSGHGINSHGSPNQMHIRCKFGQLGNSPGMFTSPHGFCMGNNEEIVVADTHNHRIQVILFLCGIDILFVKAQNVFICFRCLTLMDISSTSSGVLARKRAAFGTRGKLQSLS